MTRIFPAALAAIAVVSGCASGAATVPPRVLAAADPGAAEAPYATPVNPLGEGRPRTLDLPLADPTRMHHPETATEVGAPHDHGAEDHSQHTEPTATPTPKPEVPTPTPAPKPAATKKPSPTATATPRPSAETIYACPMHPEVRDTKSSNCPKCGMFLEPLPPATKASPTATPTATPGAHEHHHQHGSAP